MQNIIDYKHNEKWYKNFLKMEPVIHPLRDQLEESCAVCVS